MGIRGPMGAVAPGSRRGATLVEVVVGVAAAALLCAMLAGALAESRRHASLTQNLANLQQFAAGTASCAADNEERFWSFSEDPDPDPFGVPAPRIAAQAVQIIREQGDRRTFRTSQACIGRRFTRTWSS